MIRNGDGRYLWTVNWLQSLQEKVVKRGIGIFAFARMRDSIRKCNHGRKGIFKACQTECIKSFFAYEQCLISVRIKISANHDRLHRRHQPLLHIHDMTHELLRSQLAFQDVEL